MSDCSSSLDTEKPTSAMSRRESKIIFDNLGDLPASKTGKAPSSGPSLAQGKRAAPESQHDPHEPKMGKDSIKPGEDTDSPFTWLEEYLPPLPPQPSSSSGRKGSLRFSRDKSSSLGDVILGSSSSALIIGKSTLLPSDMNLHSTLHSKELVSTGVQQHCLLGLQKWFTISGRQEKLQRRVEDLEKELTGSKAARRLVESNAEASFKTAKIAVAQAVATKSHLAVTEMELEDLNSKQVKAEKIREAIEKSKDAQFEETEALYLQQDK